MEEIKYDKTKYFLDQNKNKRYVLKGSGHKGLAYSILAEIGLSEIYHFRYEQRVPAPVFLTYCGYVLVDEAQETYKVTWDSSKLVTYKFVIYCSKTIDEDYIEYLKTTYAGKDNTIEDSYDIEDKIKQNQIDEIIKEVEKVKKEQEEWKQRGLDEEAR